MSKKQRRIRLTKMTVLTAFDPSNGLPDTLEVMFDTFATILRNGTTALAVESQFDSTETAVEEKTGHSDNLVNALLVWGESGRTDAPPPNESDSDADDDSEDKVARSPKSPAPAVERTRRTRATKAIICSTQPGIPRYVAVVNDDTVEELQERLRATHVFERVDVIDVDTADHVYREACLIDQDLADEAAHFARRRCDSRDHGEEHVRGRQEWTADTCQVCGRHLGHGLRALHLGLCGPCANAPKH